MEYHIQPTQISPTRKSRASKFKASGRTGARKNARPPRIHTTPSMKAFIRASGSIYGIAVTIRRLMPLMADAILQRHTLAGDDIMHPR